MERATVRGVELAYEVVGEGDPVLLVAPVLADGFVPLMSQAALCDHHQLIRYHKRGWLESTHTPGPVTIAEHAADAAALLDHLGFETAHVVGHSSGAAVAAQLALDDPGKVHTLTLLELSLLSVPAGASFFQQLGPAFEAYEQGRHEEAVACFLSVVSGLDRSACSAVLERGAPGSPAHAVEDAETFFGVELPSLAAWTFGTGEAAAIGQPVLSVLGARTQPLWLEVAALLRDALPDVEEHTVDGVGHLLHLERPEPVARVVGDFLDRHPVDRGSPG